LIETLCYGTQCYIKLVAGLLPLGEGHRLQRESGVGEHKQSRKGFEKGGAMGLNFPKNRKEIVTIGIMKGPGRQIKGMWRAVS